MVGGVHLIYVQEYAPIAYDVVGQVAAVVYGYVISNVTGNDRTVGDACAGLQVVMLKDQIGKPAYTYQAKEMAIAYLNRIKWIRNQDIVPAICTIAVLDEDLHL
jgi:hypothetical protein